MNHTKFPVYSVQKTCDLHPRFFPSTSFPEHDHFTEDYKPLAKTFKNESTRLIIEVRYVPGYAAAQTGLDPDTTE